MINKLILAQLEKLQDAKVGEYDSLHHTFHIKKHREQEFNYNVQYLVELDDTLLNPSVNDVLASNWNNGKRPTHKYLKFAISKKVGNMLNVYGIYHDKDNNIDLDEVFEGWLPTDRIRVLEEETI